MTGFLPDKVEFFEQKHPMKKLIKFNFHLFCSLFVDRPKYYFECELKLTSSTELTS